jgi:hypothetical protein
MKENNETDSGAEGSTITWTPEGKCRLCGGTVSRKLMTSHLKACRKKNPPKPPHDAKPRLEKVFHLVVEGTYVPRYWMHVEAPADSMLWQLDRLLRETWLECCNHISAFTIEKERYSVEPLTEWEERGMDVALDEVLRLRMRFYHLYDYGTPTRLTLRVASQREVLVAWDSPLILAMNLPPRILCDSCGKLATRVSSSWFWGSGTWFCDDCASRLDSKEIMLLPVVNSPRTGVCAYTGPSPENY